MHQEIIKWYKYKFFFFLVGFLFINVKNVVFMSLTRLEKVKLKSIRSQAKVVGTLATVAGAMVITMVKGPVLELIWTKGKTNHDQQNNGTNLHHSITGAIMITIGCFSWACFVNLQVKFSSS